METVYRLLPIALTPEERNDRGQLLAMEVKLKQAVEDKKAQQVALFKSQIAQHELNIKVYAEALATGVDHREVECDQEVSMADSMVRLVRRDTKQVVGMRPLTRAEISELMRTRE